MSKNALSYLGYIALLCCVCLLVYQNTAVQKTHPQNRAETVITQIATIDSLLAGVYDGETTLEKLLEYGDFGIGTFEKLDGEMIVLNGNVYQIKADGNVYRPSLQTTTPFASVVPFSKMNVKATEIQSTLDYESIQRTINETVANDNVPIAIRMTGRFSQVKTRSVPPQKKPYPPLVEVTKNQPEFDLGTLEGTVVGFRLPKYFQGINVPGYHLHFLSQDEKRGGHVLNLTMESGRIEYSPIHQFQMLLPEKISDFSNVDLTQDRSKELKSVEQ
jgi:alpha-acetolactate decarboxylase